jgi:hypothetical protein
MFVQTPIDDSNTKFKRQNPLAKLCELSCEDQLRVGQHHSMSLQEVPRLIEVPEYSIPHVNVTVRHSAIRNPHPGVSMITRRRFISVLGII